MLFFIGIISLCVLSLDFGVNSVFPKEMTILPYGTTSLVPHSIVLAMMNKPAQQTKPKWEIGMASDSMTPIPNL
jgi:hypothetical protein